MAPIKLGRKFKRMLSLVFDSLRIDNLGSNTSQAMIWRADGSRINAVFIDRGIMTRIEVPIVALEGARRIDQFVGASVIVSKAMITKACIFCFCFDFDSRGNEIIVATTILNNLAHPQQLVKAKWFQYLPCELCVVSCTEMPIVALKSYGLPGQRLLNSIDLLAGFMQFGMERGFAPVK
jgi:hypothetical protein